MDDLKRSMYVKARNLIASGAEDFVCMALREALRSEFGFFAEMRAALEEFFPEFFALHDGYWGREMFHVKNGKHKSWWVADWKEPRLAILDFIINNR